MFQFQALKACRVKLGSTCTALPRVRLVHEAHRPRRDAGPLVDIESKFESAASHFSFKR